MDRDPDQAFIDSIKMLARALESDTHTDQQQEVFFRLTESRHTLPEGVHESIVEAFLATLISIISLKNDQRFTLRSVKALLEYLKNDANVFAKFKPSKPLLRKMNLAQHIMSTTSIQESELALDLCSFLLRYHRGLDYGDFSENPYCVQRLRRYEDFKCWSEIEDVALLAETNSKDILSFKQTNESALQEILQHLERMVRDYITKDEMDNAFKTTMLSRQPQSLHNTNLLSQASTNMDSNQYKRVLELMLELERKMESRFDDMQMDVRREVQRVGDERQIRNDLTAMVEEKLVDAFDPRQGGGAFSKLVSRVEVLEKAYDQCVKSINLVDGKVEIEAEKSLKIEDTLRDQIDLIQALNSKLALQEEAIKETKHSFITKLTTLEKEVIERAFGESSAAKFDFSAHEETIRKLEEEIEGVQKELFLFKERTDKQVQESLQLTKQTRSDYILRMKELYDENNRMIRETKDVVELVKGKHQEAIAHLDRKQQTVVQHVQQLETDFKVQVDRSLRDLEATDLKQQKEIADINDYFKKLRAEVIELGTHIGSEISRVISQSNSTLNEYGKRQQEIETAIRKQIEEVINKFGLYSNDFSNISENFLKLSDGQNRLIITANAQEQELLRLKNDYLQSTAAIRKMEDFLTNNSRLNGLVDEANKLWTFFQKFIDEHAIDRAKIIRSLDNTFTEKFNAMDWLARYAEFVTPDQINAVVLSFKDMYANNADPQIREAFITHKHNSEAVATLCLMMRNLKAKRETVAIDQETFDQNLSILLSILEPVLINDQNLEFLYKLQMVRDLCEFLFEQPLPSETPAQTGVIKVRLYFKYLIRCITSALRNEYGVQEFLNTGANERYLKRVMRVLEEFEEEEIVANSAKIVRLCLRDDAFYDRVITNNVQLGNFIFANMNKHFNSNAVIVEAAAAVRNFTRKPTYLNLLSGDSLKVLINLIRDAMHDKSKPLLLQALKNIIKHPDHERYLRQIGANDVMIMANAQQTLAGAVGQGLQKNMTASLSKPAAAQK